MELEKYGLTQGESKVYMALLRIGPSTVGKILKESQVSHSKIYDILERLVKKSLVTTVSNKRKLYSPAPPDNLLLLLKHREQEINLKKDELKKLLPDLTKQFLTHEEKQDVTLYQGVNAIKSFGELLLKELRPKDSVLILGSQKETYSRMEGYIEDWHKRRVLKKIRCKILYNSDSNMWAEKRIRLPLTEVKVLPNTMKTPISIDIAGSYVANIQHVEQPFCLLIKNSKIAESYRNYFDLLWEKC